MKCLIAGFVFLLMAVGCTGGKPPRAEDPGELVLPSKEIIETENGMVR